MKILIKSKGDAIFLTTFTVAGVILTIILTMASTGYHALVSVGAEPRIPIFGTPEAKPTWQVLGYNRLSVLIIGSDAHLKYDPGRSDTIIWALLDFRNGEVDIISIPRDLLVRIPTDKGGYFDKICHAYSYGGTSLVQAAVERFLGVSIDHVIRVDYDGFVRIIDTLGGVEINVDKQMNYDDNAGDLHIHIKKGRQTLDGKTALDYVRYRQDTMGDLARIERQQEFLAAVKKNGMRLNQLGKINDLARIVQETIYITPGKSPDDALTLREIAAILIFFTKLNDGSIQYHAIPIEIDVIYNKLSSLVPDYDKLDELMRGIFNTDGVSTPELDMDISNPIVSVQGD